MTVELAKLQQDREGEGVSMALLILTAPRSLSWDQLSPLGRTVSGSPEN